MMTKQQSRDWLRIIIWLKKTFPVPQPVIVRSIVMGKEQLGTAHFSMEYKQFEVKINRNQDFFNRILTLIHEWAHVVTWHEIWARCKMRMETENFHSKEWGIAYAEIYRSSMEWNYDRKEREDE